MTHAGKSHRCTSYRKYTKYLFNTKLQFYSTEVTVDVLCFRPRPQPQTTPPRQWTSPRPPQPPPTEAKLTSPETQPTSSTLVFDF